MAESSLLPESQYHYQTEISQVLQHFVFVSKYSYHLLEEHLAENIYYKLPLKINPSQFHHTLVRTELLERACPVLQLPRSHTSSYLRLPPYVNHTA